jgi:hypothetical protein
MRLLLLRASSAHDILQYPVTGRASSLCRRVNILQRNIPAISMIIIWFAATTTQAHKNPSSFCFLSRYIKQLLMYLMAALQHTLFANFR